MDRRCAGALLALAACIASTAAAPTASNQTALDLYDGAQQGCYYNFQHYGEGDRIMTNEPCLNCTCHNRMLMCYLRVCPFTKPIGQDCSVEKRADQCCPIVTCPDVPVDLLTSTSTTSPAEYGETGLGKLDRYGCSINGKYFPEGAKVPPTPSKPCEHCYCIRNMTTCVMQECTLHVDGCTPIYHKDVCCPVRYSCDHPEDEIPLLDDMTTTVRPTPGFLLTTTTHSPVTQMTQDCVHDDKIFADGALIKTEKACQHCYCMKGDIVCVVQECGTPMENEGKNCTSMPPREGQCCPDTYICEGDELTSETISDLTTEPSFDKITTLSPPRRVNVEGSGYRKEPGEPFTEEPTFGPDTEGSGDESFKPIDDGKVIIPDSETTRPLIPTENDDNIDQYSPSTSKVPIVDSEIIDMTTMEPDNGDNTVPSGSIDEDVPEIPISEKTTPEESKLDTESGPTTESYLAAKTTVVHEDESSIKDTITTEAQAAASKPATESESTTADSEATTEPTEVTESTPNKQGEEKTPMEITTLKDKEDEVTTKITDSVPTTENTPPPVEEEIKITPSQLPEQENEVVIKELTTESNLELSTKSGVIKTETEPATTMSIEDTISGEEHLIETTPANPVDNEIDEESYPTSSSPGRIPGEGDCLLDGVTYSNESIVPSSNNCHTSCRCISSIVKCDPIICSAPPDYMDNCQPMYDPPESCCPTYVCDHTRETVPPQSHSQMAGTESPIPTPSVQCNGDQCEISKDKEEPTDSGKTPDKCGPEGCQGADKKPDHESHPSIEECVGENCASSQPSCADGKCESPITPDQICDSENGCKIPVNQACQGEDCKTQSEIGAGEDSSAQCDSINGCKDNQIPASQPHCADGKCESPPKTNQICDSENGCQIPVDQSCQGENCKSQPDGVPTKDSSASCDNADDCKEGQVPQGVPECAGKSCKSEIGPKDTESCKDGTDCTQPEQSPTIEECKEGECRRKDVLDNTKPATVECTDSNCVPQDHIPQITDAPELVLDDVPKTTEISDETIPKEPGTDNLPKTPDVEKVTEASIFVKDEESPSTTQYDEIDKEKEEESLPSVTDVPEIKTQSPEVLEHATEKTVQKETTVTELEITHAPYEESSTNAPKLSDNETDDRFGDLPIVIEPELPKSTKQPLVDDQTEGPQEDIISDQQKHDLTTETPSIPTIHDMATEISDDTTAHTERSSPDITTEEPQHATEQGGIQTESPTTVSSGEDVKEPDNINKYLEPNVTETAESDTSALGESSTEKLDQEPIEHDAVTTPKSYSGETSPPISLETETPIHDDSEEQHDTQTATPEKLSTLSQEDQREKEETEIPGQVTSGESITRKPSDTVSVTEGMLAPDNESETKSPVLPEISPSYTRLPESTTIPQEDLYTKMPSSDTSDEIAVTPFETSDKDKVPTEAPMSIVKDNVEDDAKLTQASELPETLTTESYGTEKVPSEKESSPSDEQNIEAATEKDETVKETKMPNIETNDIPEQNANTEKSPVTISSVEQPEQPEPSVTEAGVVDSVTLVQQTSEILPVTSIPTEGFDAKSTESFTEVPAPTVPEDKTIAPTQDQSGITKDAITEIPELTIHEHTESEEDITTKVPDVSVTDISTQKEGEELPDLQDSKTNAPDVSLIESQTEATEAPDQKLVTPDHQLTEPAATDAPDVHDVPTKGPEDVVEVASESSTSEDGTTSDSRIPATEPANEVTVTPEIQDIATNIPDTFVTETQKDITGPPDSEEPTITETSEDKPHKESSDAPSSLDITTNTPKISELDSDKETSESPSSQDTTTKVPEISDASVTETPKEAPELEPEVSVTILPGTDTQKDVTEVPESQDIATSVPKISVTETQEAASEAPESQDTATNIPEMVVTGTQKDETEISNDSATHTPEISVTESQKEATEASMAPDVASEVPESTETESQSDVTPAPAAHDGTTNIPETSISETKDTTESPIAEDVSTGIKEELTTESQKEVPETSVPQDIATSAPETSVTESQKEVTEALMDQDIVTNAPEISETEPEKEVTEAPVDQDIVTSAPEISEPEHEKEVTKASVDQDIVTSGPEISETEPEKEVTKAPVDQDIVTSAPEISETEPEKEVTKAPVDQDIVTSAPEISETEPEKEVTEAPVDQDIVTSAPEISETESPKEVTEAPVSPDVATSAPESSATESLKEGIEVPVAEDIVTSGPETSATESQKEVTEATVAQDIATSGPETSATESLKEVTEATVAQDIATSAPEISETEKEVTDAPTSAPSASVTESQKEVTEIPVAEDTATSAPETSATESEKQVTETPVAQGAVTSAPETSVTESQDEVTYPQEEQNTTKAPATSAVESQNEVTEVPVAEDVATSAPEIAFTKSEKEVTETTAAQDSVTSALETSVTESQKEMTETPVAQEAVTSIPETSATESQNEITEAPLPSDIATSPAETSGTKSEKEVTETPVAQDAATSAPETSATESQKEVTNTQGIVTSAPEVSETEPEKKVTEAPVDKDIVTSAPEISETEPEKELTEAPVDKDIVTSAPEISEPEPEKEVTKAPVDQDIVTSAPEISETEPEKEVTKAPVDQDIVTSAPESSETEPEKELTKAPVDEDIVTSAPEISETEPEKEITEAPVDQNNVTSAPEISETEPEKELTKAPVDQDIVTSAPEVSEREPEKEVTEAPVDQDIVTSAPEISETEPEKEVTEAPVDQDIVTSAPELSEPEPEKAVTKAPVDQDIVTSAPEISETESPKEVTEAPVSPDVATSAPEISETETQKEATGVPVSSDVATIAPETSATESQKEVTEIPVAQDVMEDEVTETGAVQHVTAANIPDITGTEQSTKVPESLVTGPQDQTSDISTDKPTTSLQDGDSHKPDDEKSITELPIVEYAKPVKHMEPEKSDDVTELPITSDSVEPDTKSPQSSESDSDIVKTTESPVTELIKEEDDSVSKSPDQSEDHDQSTKTSEEPEQSSEYPETTPYLVLLEEHTHKKDINTMSPDEEITTGASEEPSDYEPSTQASIDRVTTETALVNEAELPIEKDESAPATEEPSSEKVTEPSSISEEKTTISSTHTEEVQLTDKPHDLENNEISTAAPDEEQRETEKPSISQDEEDKLMPSATEKPHETTAPEEEFILATTKATTIKTEEDFTSRPIVDKFEKPDEVPKPAAEPETQKPDIADELPKPGVNEVQTTEEAPLPDADSQFPPSGTSGYGQEPDYGEEDQAFGPGTCRYGGKVYVSAQQIPRDDPCDFCFCFRSDIICLQQSCPPPIHGCHEEPIQGFCCPRYECPVSMATTLNVTTTTTTTTTTLPPHFLPHAYKGAAQRRGCQIKGHTYKVGEVVRASSGPCLHCTCGGDGQMKCDPKVCTPEPMLRQMIAAAVSAKRRR